MEIVVPELVFDEERHDRTHGAKEAACVYHCVDGQVGDDVGTFVILSYLITRWREERKQYLIFRMVFPNLLYQRTALLKLSQRGGMEPDVFGIRVHLLLENTDSVAFALPHLPHLCVE